MESTSEETSDCQFTSICERKVSISDDDVVGCARRLLIGLKKIQ